ncbi:MAG TPA: helix-turn-helix domain-containing protein [Gemmatales bacterium]|nr:helix-turn-helix domain-containing protein [Gemmatales bacterium]
MQRWDSRFHQLSSGPFVGEIHQIQAGGVQLTKVTLNQVIQSRGTQPPGSYVFVPVTPHNESALWRGQKVTRGRMIILGPNDVMDHRTSSEYGNAFIAVNAELVRRNVSVLLGAETEDMLAGRMVINVQTQMNAQQRLQGWIMQLMAHPEVLQQPHAVKLIEDECIRRIASEVSHAEGLTQADRRVVHRYQLVRKAEEFVLHSIESPMTMLDLCRELEVSERTLHYAFREIHGISPMAYLKTHRLNRVRQELKSEDYATHSIAEIAGRWGFWHTGEFAADYRRLFGELPSATRSLNNQTTFGTSCLSPSSILLFPA